MNRIEEIYKYEEMLYKNKLKYHRLVISTILWSILGLEIGVGSLQDKNIIEGLITSLILLAGGQTYSTMMGTKDVIEKINIELKKLKK